MQTVAPFLSSINNPIPYKNNLILTRSIKFNKVISLYLDLRNTPDIRSVCPSKR